MKLPPVAAPFARVRDWLPKLEICTAAIHSAGVTSSSVVSTVWPPGLLMLKPDPANVPVVTGLLRVVPFIVTLLVPLETILPFVKLLAGFTAGFTTKFAPLLILGRLTNPDEESVSVRSPFTEY